MEFFQISLVSDRLVESQNRHRVRERVHFISEETGVEKRRFQQDRKGTQDADCQLLGGHRGVRQRERERRNQLPAEHQTGVRRTESEILPGSEKRLDKVGQGKTVPKISSNLSADG